tara:strand:+ start:1574 stop:2836 length:1263 start_codon:yes stop_codon:yes gene_type:complete
MIVIKSGPEFSKIYADKAFDKWGAPTDKDIRIVEEWTDIDIPDHAERYDANIPYDVNFDEYCKMIEHTLWIFNNEMIKLKTDVHMTGGGVHWMFQKGNVNIFDISKTQVAFIDSLLQNWDGENYGQFVYNFITKNKVLHFHVNLNEEQNSNKDLILNKNEFITKINENFEMLKNKYDPNWQWNPENVKVNNGDLISQLSTVYLGKALVSNIFDFKYYFVKCYVDDAYELLSPSTRSFIQQNTHLNINTNNPACKKVELGVPASDIYEEIQNIKKYLRTHRSESGIGWRAFCIHGQSYKRTKEDSYYPDFLGHTWTPEALEHMPVTVKWLRSLGYKSFQRVRVMCLLPKSFINLHKDSNHSELDAVNVAINNPKECKFYLQNHGVLEFKPGTAYQLDLVNYHTVINNSNVPRYHIIIHGKK